MYNKYSLPSENDEKDIYFFTNQIKSLDMYELIDTIGLIYTEIKELYNVHFHMREIDKVKNFDDSGYTKYVGDYEYSLDNFEKIEHQIEKTEHQFETCIYEALNKFKNKPHFFQDLIEVLSHSDYKKSEFLFTFHVFSQHLLNVENIILFLDSVSQSHSKFTNESFYTMFSSVISKLSLYDLSIVSNYVTQNMYFKNKKDKAMILNVLIKENPFAFNNLSIDLQEEHKYILLMKNTLNHWEDKAFREERQDLSVNNFDVSYSNFSANDVKSLLNNLFKNYFIKDINNANFILESSSNNISVANYFSQNLKSSHQIFKNYDILSKLIVIDPTFANNAPESYWNDKNNIINMIKQNQAIYYSLPQNIKKDPIFNMELQFSKIIPDVFINHLKYEKINNENTLLCLNTIIDYTEKFKEDIRKSSSNNSGNNAQIFVTTSLEALSLLSKKIEPKFIENNVVFRDSLKNCFFSLTAFETRYKLIIPKNYDIDFLSILCYFPEKEIAEILNLNKCALCDILASSYSANISEDKILYITKILEDYTFDCIESNFNTDAPKENLEFILNNFQHSFYIKKENQLSFTEVCEFLSILPLSKLQDCLNNEIPKNNFFINQLLSNFNSEFNSEKLETPLEAIFYKVSEIKMHQDQNKNRENPPVIKKVLKF